MEEYERVRHELKKVIKEYEKRFNRSIPGWFCADEDRLTDLKKALESNVPYPEDPLDIEY